MTCAERAVPSLALKPRTVNQRQPRARPYYWGPLSPAPTQPIPQVEFRLYASELGVPLSFRSAARRRRSFARDIFWDGVRYPVRSVSAFIFSRIVPVRVSSLKMTRSQFLGFFLSSQPKSSAGALRSWLRT